MSESLKVRCSLHSQHTDTDPPLTDTKGVRSCLNVCCLWFILIKQLLPSRPGVRLMSHRARIPSLHCPRHHHQRNVCTLSKNQSQQCLVGGGQRDNACRFQAPQCLKQLFCSEADDQPGALEREMVESAPPETWCLSLRWLTLQCSRLMIRLTAE